MKLHIAIKSMRVLLGTTEVDITLVDENGKSLAFTAKNFSNPHNHLLPIGDNASQLSDTQREDLEMLFYLFKKFFEGGEYALEDVLR